jgi:hypothetical protein
MNQDLMVFGIIFLVLGYLVGVKKMTWLLSGFNEKRVKDKNKLAHLVGGTEAVLGFVLIIGGILGAGSPKFLIMFCIAIMMGLVFYVNSRMAE